MSAKFTVTVCIAVLVVLAMLETATAMPIYGSVNFDENMRPLNMRGLFSFAAEENFVPGTFSAETNPAMED